MNETGQVTGMLERARLGDRRVADQLMPLIYDELRRLAQHYLRGERPGHTLQATALVHEAYVRLVGSEVGPWQNRAHFFAAAATAIRRILVQHARASASLKRGGDRSRVALDVERLPSHEPIDANEQILAVDEALARLAAIDPQKARLVELRFFSGMTTEEMSESLGVSPRTVAREWDLAKAWLSRELMESRRDDQ
jgi:RNA polymerase sigma-70 factor, ECF subfamily